MELFFLITAFFVGLAIGSFINVCSLRYDEEKGFRNFKNVEGRSKCMKCRTTLRWFELIPLLSFVIQGGKCRNCKVRLSWQYPIVEFLTAIIAVGLVYTFTGSDLVIWSLVSFLLITLSAIDWRLKIIPDEINLTLGLLGIVMVVTKFIEGNFGELKGSLLGYYAAIFGLRENLWLNHLAGLLVGFGIFGLVILLTRGRGMGMGDLKLGAAAGLLMGWPDILLALMIAFIIGSLWGVSLIVTRNKTLKSAIPFGPFIVMGMFIVLFFGRIIMHGYFSLIGSII